MSQLSEILGGGAASGDNSMSLVARLGQLGQKYTDPLAWIFGRKYTDKLVDIADFSNKQFSSVMKPFDKVDQTINPMRRFNVVPGVNSLKGWVANKPADAAAIAAGAYFGGGALGNMMGGGGGGAESGGGFGNLFGGGNGSIGGGNGFAAGENNWMKLLNGGGGGNMNMGGLLGGGQQQQQPQQPQLVWVPWAQQYVWI